MKNILFICLRNQWQSPTAEKVYSKDPRINVRSAGVFTDASMLDMLFEQDKV